MRTSAQAFALRQFLDGEPRVVSAAAPAILVLAPLRHAGYFFFAAFLAFFFVAFFAFFAFLAIVSSQGFHGLKRDTEACLAEGQPRNILDDDPTRFGGRCRVPSWRCHHVIHSCYAF